MTKPTTNNPPAYVTRDRLCEALRVLGFEPEAVIEAHILAENIVVIWDRGEADSDVDPVFRSYTTVVEIFPEEPVATCANCGRGMNAGAAMCCPLPEGGVA